MKPVLPSVLMVCWGNICRSPTFEVVCRQIAGDRWHFDSCGISDEHSGEHADTRTINHAARRGYDLSAHRAKGIGTVNWAQFSHILVMERSHLSLLTHYGTALMERTSFAMQWAGYPDMEVKDPYYGSEPDFIHVLELAELVARKLCCA